MKGTLLERPKKIFRPYVASHFRGLTESSRVVLPAHALQTVRASSKSVGNEEHFIRETETVFRPYLASHCSGATEISHLVLPTGSASLVEIGQ
jgi:hypothetical protein